MKKFNQRKVFIITQAIAIIASALFMGAYIIFKIFELSQICALISCSITVFFNLVIIISSAIIGDKKWIFNGFAWAMMWTAILFMNIFK